MLEKICKICGKTFKKPYNCSIKEWNETRKFCSKQCRIDYTKTLRPGTGHVCNGYRIISDGRKKKHYEHRLLVEKSIGRKLLPKEVVHHIDGNKLNNSLDNLKLVSSTSEHSKIHTPKGSKFGINSKLRIATSHL